MWDVLSGRVEMVVKWVRRVRQGPDCDEFWKLCQYVWIIFSFSVFCNVERASWVCPHVTDLVFSKVNFVLSWYNYSFLFCCYFQELFDYLSILWRICQLPFLIQFHLRILSSHDSLLLLYRIHLLRVFFFGIPNKRFTQYSYVLCRKKF